MEKGKKGKRKKISKNLSRSFDPRRVKGSTKEGREEEREVLFLARAKTGTANLLPESWTRQKLPLPHLHRPRDRIARHDVSINYEGTPANGDPSPPPHTHTYTHIFQPSRRVFIERRFIYGRSLLEQRPPPFANSFSTCFFFFLFFF